jgi:vancomycin resistance protein YoaR
MAHAPDEPSPLDARRPPRRGVRLVGAVALVAVALGLSAYLVLADRYARAASQLELRALGRAIDPQQRELAQSLADAYLRERVTLRFEQQVAARSRGELGARVELPALQELLRDASDARSPLRKLHAQQNGRNALGLPIPAHLEAAQSVPWLQAFAARIDQPARPARLELATGKLIPARPGRALDVQATLDALEDAMFRGLREVRAVVRTLEVQQAPASKPDARAVLGSFESEQAPDDAARRLNLTQLARALDGALLAPGAVFDLRAQLGLARGVPPLRTGPVALEGDRNEAVLAQLAGTVFASALFAGLPVLEQHARPFPMATLETGFEAAINERENLLIQNDREATLVLSVSVRDGRVRASWRGRSEDAREVRVDRLIEVAAPYLEHARSDARGALGTRTVLQRGLPGLHVTLTRTIAGGEEKVERDASYLPIPRVVAVGSATVTSSGALRADAHREPLIDEYLALSMRPGFVLPEEVARREGRTGTPGWTVPPR